MRHLLGLLLVAGAYASNNVYLAGASAGANDGTSCANAKIYTYFNSSGNWSATPSGIQIGPGTTAHLCGTITVASGTTALTAQGSGSNGSPVTILFEASAILESPVWPGNPNGGIALGANNYITVDGGSNGILRNTANGSGLSSSQSSYGVTGSGTNQIVKNLSILDMFIRTGTGGETGLGNDASVVQSVTLTGANSIADNVTITYSGFALNVTGDNGIIRNSSIQHSCHGGQMQGAHWYFYNNHVYDSDIWDASNNFCHQDGLHCWANQTQTAYVYNNRFDGASGTHYNQPIFLEGGDSPTRCFVNGGTSYIFNNISLLSVASNFGGPPTGGTAVNVTNTGDIMANNLEISAYNGTGTPQGLILQNIPSSNCPSCGVSIYNNGVSSFGNGINIGVISANNSIDYNAYERCSSSAGCFIGGTCNGCSTISTWQSASGYDAHAIVPGPLFTDMQGAANAYFNLNSACILGSVGANCTPQATSPFIGAGKNLYSVCNGQPNPGLGALCFDAAGVARPSSGAWDIGAYQYVGASQWAGTFRGTIR